MLFYKDSEVIINKYYLERHVCKCKHGAKDKVL